jgi:hypothetical protein
MAKVGVLSEVRTEFLTIIYTSFGHKVLMHNILNVCGFINAP